MVKLRERSPMEESMFRRGATEDLAQEAAHRIKQEGQSQEEVDAEVLEFIQARMDEGAAEDDIILDLVEFITKDPAKKREILQSAMQKIGSQPQGAGHEKQFDLPND